MALSQPPKAAREPQELTLRKENQEGQNYAFSRTCEGALRGVPQSETSADQLRKEKPSR